MQTSTISDYNLGGEGDLFKAPEPVIGEPLMAVDPMTAAISMISCGEDVISPQSLTVSDIESSIESGQLISEVFYECRKDLLAQQGNGTPLCDALSIKIPSLQIDENVVVDEKLFAEGALQKSLSSSCLRPVDGVHEAPLRPRFLDFPVLDFGAFNGMRRAFSEGDIKVNSSSNLFAHFVSTHYSLIMNLICQVNLLQIRIMLVTYLKCILKHLYIELGQ